MSRYHYERLTTESASHLMIEDSRRFAHALTIMVFDRGPLGRAERAVDVGEITRGIEARLHLAPRFRERLKWIPYEDHPCWVDDGEFQLDYHVRHTALPHPGTEVQLLRLASRLMSSRLQRSRPLWECWVVEGLDQDRFALIGKVHNSVIDGDSGADLFQTLLSPNPMEPFEAGPEFTPRPVPSGIELVRDEVFRRFRLPLKAIERMRVVASDRDVLRHDLGKRMEGIARLLGYSVIPPRTTPINGRVGPHRRVQTVTLPLEPILAAHRALGCSVHDVMLTVLSCALRRFFRDRLVHPASLDLRVATPVQQPAAAGHDEIAEWVIELPIWEADPARVAEIVREQTRDQYAAHPALGARTLFSVARWSGSRLVALAARSLSNHAPVHTSLVNVPGSQTPLYFMGARLRETYAAVPLRGEQAVSFSAMSYDGNMCIGLNADPDVVPDVMDLARAMEGALADVVSASQQPAPRLRAVQGGA